MAMTNVDEHDRRGDESGQDFVDAEGLAAEAPQLGSTFAGRLMAWFRGDIFVLVCGLLMLVCLGPERPGRSCSSSGSSLAASRPSTLS